MTTVADRQASRPDTLPEGRGHPGVIPQVCAQHLEEFQFLWTQHAAALRSPDYTLRDVAQLEARIAAHLDALLLAGEAATAALEAALAGDDPQAACAAAQVLLCLRSRAAADRVAGALRKADAEKLEALRPALCHAPIDLIADVLRETAASGPAPLAVTALEALAFHRLVDPAIDRLVEFLQDEDPLVRRTAWRIMAMSNSTAASR